MYTTNTVTVTVNENIVGKPRHWCVSALYSFKTAIRLGTYHVSTTKSACDSLLTSGITVMSICTYVCK